MNETKYLYSLPHHRLVAFSVAKELLIAVVGAKITDAELRDQATRAAKSAALNTAEGAGRISPRDKARCFAIARGECAEAAAAIEIAAAVGATTQAAVDTVNAIAHRLCAMLTRLCR
jgi:four helix bundle protein